jgi:hypothetical protein
VLRFVIVALGWLLALSSATAAPSRNVLVIFSSNRLLPAHTQVDTGLRERLLNPPDRSTKVFEEYLDQPAFFGADYERIVEQFLRDKYAANPPDAIVAVGQFALAFVVRHWPQLFSGVPVVHAGVERPILQTLGPLPGDVIGVEAGYDLPGTIRLALLLHPVRKHFVVVTGSSDRDR